MLPSTLFGLAIGAGLLIIKRDPHNPTELDLPGVDDRAYRLTNNTVQNKIDKYSTIGAAAGAILGVATRSGVLPSAATGIALGPLYFAAEKTFQLDQYYPK
jgi:hypothetical protein